MKSNNEIQKELQNVKTQDSLVAISIENPEWFFNGKFSNDGMKLLSVSVYENSAKAKFYAEKGNVTVFNNGNVL